MKVDELTEESILEALRTGEFYASNGVTLNDVSSDTSALSLSIQATSAESFLTRFIGMNGRVLSDQVGSAARYSIKGDEGYVRATVISSTGAKAWVQPVFLNPVT